MKQDRPPPPTFSRRYFLALPAGLAALPALRPAFAASTSPDAPAKSPASGQLSITIGDHREVSRAAVREPALFHPQSGDLLLTYHVQGDRHFAERQGMRSTDGGRTWRPEPHRAHREQAIGENGRGLVLAMDIYTFERRPGEYVGSFFRSTDGGKSFTGPHETVVRVDRVAAKEYPTREHFPPEEHPMRKFYQPLPEYYEPTVRQASRRRGPSFWRNLITHDGRWLATMQGHFHGDRQYRAFLVESVDEGRTWSFVSTIAFRHGEPGNGFVEPALRVVADGSLLCVLRRGGRLPMAQCRSLDGGRTWSPPELLPGHGVDPDLLLLSNGVLACTFGRPGLHLMFSVDGSGREWTDLTTIGAWRSSTYMGIAEIAPGELLLVYDRSETPRGQESDPDKAWVGATNIRVRRTDR